MASRCLGLALWLLPSTCVATLPALPAVSLEGIGEELPTQKAQGKRNGRLSLTSIGSGEAINDFLWPVQSQEINCTVGVHGHSSAAFAKKSFTLHLQTPNGKKMKTGFGHDWRPDHGFDLFGPYADRSLMRNALAYSWANGMGVWAPKATFVELSFKTPNGTVDYQGVYMILELVKPHRLGLHHGDMLIKYDWPDSDPYLRHAWFSARSAFVLSYPEDEVGPGEPLGTELPEMCLPPVGTNTYAMAQLLNESMGIASAPNVSLLDIDSWINYVLFSELTGNPDGYKFSTFSYFKNGKLYGGPAWDDDLAFGNIQIPGMNFMLDGKLWQEAKDESFVGAFIDKLMPMTIGDGSNQTFAQACEKRWATVRSDLLSHDAIDTLISDYARILNGSGAVSRNFHVWVLSGKLQGDGVNPYLNPYQGLFYDRTWSEEIDALRTWVHYRVRVLDVIFAAGGDRSATTPDQGTSGIGAAVEAWAAAFVSGLLLSAMVLLPFFRGALLRIAAKLSSRGTPVPSAATVPLLQEGV